VKRRYVHLFGRLYVWIVEDGRLTLRSAAEARLFPRTTAHAALESLRRAREI